MLRLFIIVAAAVFSTGAFAGGTFYGDPCLEDCSGHEAGYEWADRKGIDSVDDCGGNSNSFIEGCEAYVEENQSNDNGDSDSDNDADGGDDQDN